MKSKFAGLAEARMREPESETGETETPAKPAKQKVKKKTTRQPNKSTNRKVDKASSKAGKIPLRSVSARTSEENRTWWIYQARLQNTTLQDAIVEALEKRFGLPKKLRLK